jgi:RNA polymerase sigma-70 factor (ECF subfamily)
MSTNDSVANIQEQIVALLPSLRRFARNLARDPHDADDVVQIAVERALQRLDQWRSDARLDSWLFKILRNAWIDEVRARARRAKILMPEEAGEHIGEAVMERAIDRWSAEAALSRLPEDQRLAVGLVLIEGLSYKDAAEVLDVPLGTLTSRLSRGREALQDMLRLPEGDA